MLPAGADHHQYGANQPAARAPPRQIDTDRRLARARLKDAVLSGLARRRQPAGAGRQQAVRHAEIRRLALALREAARALKVNRTQLAAIVNDLVPGLTTRPGSGPISAGHGLRMRPLNREGLNGLLRCLMGADCVRMGSGGSSSSREASWATCSAHPQDRLTPAPPWP